MRQIQYLTKHLSTLLHFPLSSILNWSQPSVFLAFFLTNSPFFRSRSLDLNRLFVNPLLLWIPLSFSFNNKLELPPRFATFSLFRYLFVIIIIEEKEKRVMTFSFVRLFVKMDFSRSLLEKVPFNGFLVWASSILFQPLCIATALKNAFVVNGVHLSFYVFSLVV